MARSFPAVSGTQAGLARRDGRAGQRFRLELQVPRRSNVFQEVGHRLRFYTAPAAGAARALAPGRRRAAARRLVWKDLGLYRAVRTDAPAPQSAGEALLCCSGALWLAPRGGGCKPGVRMRLGMFGDITAKRAARLAISYSCACACVQACPVPARPRTPRRHMQPALRNALSRSCYPVSPTLAVA